jgi:putative ABC transport system permease protein
MLTDLLYRLRSLFRRETVEAEMGEELRFHYEHQIEKLMAAGLSRDQATRQARLLLGGNEQLKEECRDARGVQFFENFVRDLRYSLRMLRKSPGFTIVAVLTLALGIGANTAIFSVIDSVLLSALPYPDPERLVTIKQNDSLLNIDDIRQQTKTLARGGGITLERMDYTGGPEPLQIRAAYVNAGLLETLGVSPTLGRMISHEEDVKGGPHNMVITHRFWQEFLSGDANVLGRSLTLNGNRYTVIGVMPANFALPEDETDIFVSLWVAYPEAAPFRGVHFMRTYWRLNEGVTIEQAQADLSAIAGRLAKEFPDTEGKRQKTLVPLHQWLVGDIRPALLVLFGAVGLVFLIACANFAGLLTARAIARRQEFVLRASLGAGRSRLLVQAITESVVLSLLGGAIGLALANWGTSLLVSLEPAALDRFRGIQMDARLFLFIFGISLLTGIVFGLIPALGATNGNTADALKESGRGNTAGKFSHAFRNGLVAAEFALALILLVAAGLMMKGFARLQSVNPGFDPTNLMTMHLQLPVTRYDKIPQQTAFRRELLARLNGLPGVQAAMVTDLPFGGNYLDHRFVVDGHPAIPVGNEPTLQTLSVMGDYFSAMQIPILAGRGLTEMDRENQPLVAVVSEELVRRFFPNENPLGARIDFARTNEPHQWMTIVGVARDVKHGTLNEAPEATMYAPFAQSDESWRRWMSLVVRQRGLATDSSSLIAEIKQQVWAIDSQIPVSEIRSMDDLMSVSLARQRFNMMLLGLFAGLAMLLAAVGIYGTMAYRVSQRTNEIGIHMALGAQRADVLKLVFGDGAKLALAGIAVGVVGAAAITRVMASLLFEVKPTDPATFVLTPLLLAAVALVACYIPARRAMRVDPMVALRHE